MIQQYGNGAIEGAEIHGDANGNNIIDNGETNLTSVDELDANSVQLTAYPNPATDNLTISYVIDGNANNARMDVYDVLGQKVTSHALNSNKGQVNLKVDNLNAGVYFCSIKVDNKAIRTERVIVK
ncbi:MAG: hypothetical protein COB15_03570 [Flavobacteriales bacterium]|nr:MAG: hypothetical protein COB15_03570 [Flavobacteriales bacterium]